MPAWLVTAQYMLAIITIIIVILKNVLALNQGIWVPTVPLSTAVLRVDCVYRHLKHHSILRTQYSTSTK